MEVVETLAQLKASSALVCYFASDHGAGIFRKRAGDFSAQIQEDAHGAIFNEINGITSHAYVREYTYVSVDMFGADNTGVLSASSAINRAIDLAHTLNLGDVHVPAGKYKLTHPINLKSNVKLVGAGACTEFLQHGVIGIRIRHDEYIMNGGLRNLMLRYCHETPDENHKALMLGSAEHSVFEDLYFDGYDDQIICHIAPTYQNIPAKNYVFNKHSRWHSRTCRIGIVIDGKDGGSEFGTDRYNSKFKRLVPVSNNSWDMITFRKIKERGLVIKQWCDTERFAYLFMQLHQNNAIGIDLNPTPNEFRQVDRIHFISPCVVFDSRVTDPSTCRGLRIGSGVHAIYVDGMVTDKLWDDDGKNPIGDITMFEDRGAQTYDINYLQDGRGPYHGFVRSIKDHSSLRQDVVTIPAHSTSVRFEHGLYRAPKDHEVSLEALTPIGTNEIGRLSITDTEITIGLTSPAVTDTKIIWRANLMEWGK